MFIEKIIIKEILNLKNIEIDLGKDKKHLILTGKNGCGKTTVLTELKKVINASIDTSSLISTYKNIESIESTLNSETNVNSRKKLGELLKHHNISRRRMEDSLNEIKDKLDLEFFDIEEVVYYYFHKQFISFFFGAKRNSNIELSNGVEKLDLKDINDSKLNKNFLKYLVHLKTQQAYAYLNKNQEKLDRINNWFNRFEETIQEIFETKDIKLIYDEDKYNFKLKEPDKEFDFTTLSDGYSAILDIVTELMLRMEKEDSYSYDYNLHGIVLIDEIETHLHINLQKKIMKILTKMFPNIQFIVTTHSPFILNSLDNAVVFDLEKKLRVENLDLYSYDRLVETYFNNDKYNSELVTKLNKYEKLALSKSKTEEEIKEEIELRSELSQITYDMAKEANLKFKEIEIRRFSLDV